LQTIIEKKHFLDGTLIEYNCTLVHIEEKLGILKYIVEKPYNISGLILPKGTVTYGFYWTDRRYTLYRWYYRGKNIGNYFNIADRIKLEDNEFHWRDLILDVLVKFDHTPQILDEDELPENIDEELRKYIDQSIDDIMTNFMEILAETDLLI